MSSVKERLTRLEKLVETMLETQKIFAERLNKWIAFNEEWQKIELGTDLQKLKDRKRSENFYK